MMQYDYPAYSTRVESHEHTDYLTTSHVSSSTQPQIAAPPTPRRQIQINSTIDADIGMSHSNVIMYPAHFEHILCTTYAHTIFAHDSISSPYIKVLRRVIEDRAAIIALTTRSSENEAELMKAKTRQLNIIKNLDQQDEEIARLTTKAKAELVEYHKKSKEYIQSFIQAFQDGDLNMLPQHPFVPLLHELEQAINRRRATLIEKVQSDDRIRRLVDQLSRERVPSSVVKKNEGEYNDYELNVLLMHIPNCIRLLLPHPRHLPAGA